MKEKLKISKVYLDAAICRRTGNAMAKRKKTKIQTWSTKYYTENYRFGPRELKTEMNSCALEW